MDYHIRTPYCVTCPDQSTIYAFKLPAPHNLGVKRRVAQRIKRGSVRSTVIGTSAQTVFAGVLRDFRAQNTP